MCHLTLVSEAELHLVTHTTSQELLLTGAIHWAWNSRISNFEFRKTLLSRRNLWNFVSCRGLDPWLARQCKTYARRPQVGKKQTSASITPIRPSPSGSLFLSFFLGWRIPNSMTGLSGWWAPDQSHRTQALKLSRTFAAGPTLSTLLQLLSGQI